MCCRGNVGVASESGSAKTSQAQSQDTGVTAVCHDYLEGLACSFCAVVGNHDGLALQNMARTETPRKGEKRGCLRERVEPFVKEGVLIGGGGGGGYIVGDK